MSSQGPRVDPTASVDQKGFAEDPAFGTPVVSKGYQFTTGSIRDASDWLSYKKQLLILNELKPELAKDPWFVKGNDYRLQKLEGQYKKPEECDGCNGAAFVNELFQGGGGNMGRIYLGKSNARTVKFYSVPNCGMNSPLDKKYYVVYTFTAPETTFYNLTLTNIREAYLYLGNANITLSDNDIYTCMLHSQECDSYSENIQNYIFINNGTQTKPVYLNAGDTMQIVLIAYSVPSTSTFYLTKNTDLVNLGYELYTNLPDQNNFDVQQPSTWGTRDDTMLSKLLTTGGNVGDNGVIVPFKDGMDNISLRGYGFITPKITGLYTFYLVHDDGLDLFINGDRVYQFGGTATIGDNATTNSIILYAGMKYSIEFLWVNGSGDLTLAIPSYDVFDGVTTNYTDFASLCSKSPDLFVSRELWNKFSFGNPDDDSTDIPMSGFVFYANGDPYGDGYDSIYMSTNNILSFGASDSTQYNTYQDWLDNQNPDYPAILFGMGDRYTTSNTYYTNTQTIGDYQYIAIIMEWFDYGSDPEDGCAYVQIRLIRNTVTNEQWIEYKAELMTNIGSSIWRVFMPDNQQDVFQNAFQLSNPQPGSSFLLHSVNYGRTWTFQNNTSFTLA